MIDETRTLELFGYTSDELSKYARRFVVKVCDECGATKNVCYRDYHDLCQSCASKNHPPISEDTRRRMSEAQKGKKHTPESRRKISEYQKTTVASAETCKRMSEAQKKVSRRGAHHPNWKGGISPWRNALAKTLSYKNWRKAVFERDDYTCKMCNERGGKLQAHHIRPIRDNKNTLLIYDINNGITLCKECHQEVNGHEQEFESLFDRMVASHVLFAPQ